MYIVFIWLIEYEKKNEEEKCRILDTNVGTFKTNSI